jgi:hypothetical protein
MVKPLIGLSLQAVEDGTSLEEDSVAENHLVAEVEEMVAGAMGLVTTTTMALVVHSKEPAFIARSQGTRSWSAVSSRLTGPTEQMMQMMKKLL